MTEDMPTLAQPTKVECGAVHNKGPTTSACSESTERSVRRANSHSIPAGRLLRRPLDRRAQAAFAVREAPFIACR
jgi:hypothetical protein